MANHTQCWMQGLLIGCAISASISPMAWAAGDGSIVVQRDVHPYSIGRKAAGPDPYPTTVNANPSAQIVRALSGGELSDGDFASVSSGTSITRTMMPDGNLPGLNAINGVSNLSAGNAPGHSSGGATGGIAGQISGSLRTGLAPLNALGSLAGGK